MSDLVVGGRKSRRQYLVRSIALIAAVAVTAIIVTYFIYRRSVAYEIAPGHAPTSGITLARTPGSAPELKWESGSLAWLGQIAVLRASGDPHQLGVTQGRLLAARLPASLRPFAEAVKDLAVRPGVMASLLEPMRRNWMYRFSDDGMTSADREFLAGVVRGAAASGVSLSHSSLLRSQTTLDIGRASHTTAERVWRIFARSLTVVADSSQLPGRLWIARTFALPGLDDAGDSLVPVPVLHLSRPEGKLPWASVGWPGLVGAVTAINREGIVVCVHPTRIHDLSPTRTARPAPLLARDVIESAGDLDTAIRMIESTPVLGAASFVIIDGRRGTWAVVERGPSTFETRRNPPGRVVGDLLESPTFAADPEVDRLSRVLPTVARVRRASKLARAGFADASSVATLLRDRKNVEGVTRPDGNRAAIADPATLHAVIIDPAALVLWIADGPVSGPMRAIDLRYELRGEGNTPTPPPDIAAEADHDPWRDENLRFSRAQLRLARRAMRDGRSHEAQEAVLRALARCPRLPEALELLAQLAVDRGETEAARAAIDAWKNVGPDSPLAEHDLGR